MSSTAAPAAPALGAAQPQAERRARLLALLARLDAQAAAPRHACLLAPPPSSSPLDNPATDPCRWQGFL